MSDEDKAMLDKIKNRAICADCRTVFKYIPDGVVDLICCDPPYNQKYGYDGYSDNMTPEEYWAFLNEVFTACRRIMKDNSTIYVKQAMENIYPMMTILNKIATFHNLIIWQNPSQKMPKKNFGSAYEIILMYIIGEPTFNEYAEKRKSIDDVPADSNLRKTEYRGKMWNYWGDIPRISAGALLSKEAILEPNTLTKAHSCQFPMHLAARAILFSSNPGDLVLDMFSGSFTTAATAKRYGRDFIACDVVKKYQEIGETRLKKMDEELSQSKLFDNSVIVS